MSINSTTETSRRDADSKVEDNSDIRDAGYYGCD